ncbi:MAG: hypothetical protein U1B80_08825 [Anaerolineaceae bacterium]|nr:hypothetical protein [Anaerolineaceae bacterium]
MPIVKHIERLTKRIPLWLSVPLVALLVVVLIFTTLIAWRVPLQRVNQAALPGGEAVLETTATSEAGEVDATPIPIEWENNIEQTNGIIMGAVLLVMIVVGGTLGAIRRRV